MRPLYVAIQGMEFDAANVTYYRRSVIFMYVISGTPYHMHMGLTLGM